ncbi:MAG: acetate kinase [Clostridium sp.]|nr:acetate kinase [Clostridium sp.]MCM1444742.1 acetate kinase [Candidatus Amulumruptor caecigallinarius]
MKILSVNTGSSSLKFRLYEMPEENVLISGNFERIGIDNSFYTLKINDEKIKKEISLENHKIAFEILVKELIENNIVESLDEIKGIGNRVVQGGSYFDKSVIVDDDVINKIDELSVLAPLHNPAAIIGIKAEQEIFKNAVITAVFDTAFHQTMKRENYFYALPYEWEKEYKIRKYGAHGTSHKYIATRANEILNRNDTKLIICHIGSGASISAVKNGVCINTSMGLTPNAGLIMGTRCGDIDATIIPYIMEKANVSTNEMDTILNKKSGLLGISGVSSDVRDIVDGMQNGNDRCLLAISMFVRRIIDYIAKYYVELNGCDAIILTAGVGENSIPVRERILEGLEVLGVKLDKEKNKITGKEICITTPDSKIPCYIIPTDEELMISRDTYSFIK